MAQGIRLSDEQIERVGQALETSPSWRAAADYAGIHEDTVHLYRRRAEQYVNRHKEDQNFQDESDPDYFPFAAVRAWQEARSRLEMRLVNGVLEAIPKDWKAAHAMLKSGWPQDYSDRVEVTGAGGGPVQIEQLKSEALERAEQAIKEIRRKRQDAGSEPDDADTPD